MATEDGQSERRVGCVVRPLVVQAHSNRAVQTFRAGHPKKEPRIVIPPIARTLPAQALERTALATIRRHVTRHPHVQMTVVIGRKSAAPPRTELA